MKCPFPFTKEIQVRGLKEYINQSHNTTVVTKTPQRIQVQCVQARYKQFKYK